MSFRPTVTVKYYCEGRKINPRNPDSEMHPCIDNNPEKFADCELSSEGRVLVTREVRSRQCDVCETEERKEW